MIDEIQLHHGDRTTSHHCFVFCDVVKNHIFATKIMQWLSCTIVSTLKAHLPDSLLLHETSRSKSPFPGQSSTSRANDHVLVECNTRLLQLANATIPLHGVQWCHCCITCSNAIVMWQKTCLVLLTNIMCNQMIDLNSAFGLITLSDDWFRLVMVEQKTMQSSNKDKSHQTLQSMMCWKSVWALVEHVVWGQVNAASSHMHWLIWIVQSSLIHVNPFFMFLVDQTVFSSDSPGCEPWAQWSAAGFAGSNMMWTHNTLCSTTKGLLAKEIYFCQLWHWLF